MAQPEPVRLVPGGAVDRPAEQALLAAAAACGVAVPVAFTLAAVAVRVPELPRLLATVTRRARR